jgi:hypothetical protein
MIKAIAQIALLAALFPSSDITKSLLKLIAENYKDEYRNCDAKSDKQSVYHYFGVARAGVMYVFNTLRHTFLNDRLFSIARSSLVFFDKQLLLIGSFGSAKASS